MTELNPTLFQLDQVVSLETKSTLLTSQVTSCGKLGVAIIKTCQQYYLIACHLQEDFKTQWIHWYNDPLMNPQTLCFSTQNDLLLIATCSGILAVVPTKQILNSHHHHRKVRVVKAKDESEIARRAMPMAIAWWATNESKALAIVGTNHGLVIIIDLVDGKEIGHVKISEKSITKLEQVADESNDNIYLFISDSSGKHVKKIRQINAANILF